MFVESANLRLIFFPFAEQKDRKDEFFKKIFFLNKNSLHKKLSNTQILIGVLNDAS